MEQRRSLELLFTTRICEGVPQTQSANCCFSSIVRLPTGELLISWRVGSQKDSADGAIWMSRSVDGTSWTAPQEIIRAGIRDGVLGEPHYGPLTVLADGRILCAVMWVDRSDSDRPFFSPKTEGLLPLQTLFLESHDLGNTWREIGRLDDAPYGAPLAITGSVLELADGAWACPFEVNKNYDDAGPWRHAAALKFSYDAGRSWPECVEIANDPSGRRMYWDARVMSAADGHYRATFWTFDRVDHVDRTIHWAESHDAGRTWSAPRDLGVVGQVAEFVELGDGRWLLVYVDRYQTRSIRAMLSAVDGSKIGEEIVVYQHPAGKSEIGEGAATTDYLQDMELWTFGRIQTVADARGSVWVVYYAGDSRSTGIYCARLGQSSS